MLAAMAGWGAVFASPAFTNLVRSSPAANSLFQLVSSDKADFSKGSNPVFLRLWNCFQTINGSVKLDSVSFAYPTRPNILAANGLSIAVRRGQSIALVGSSGCGKSTVIQLLERFYAYEKGTIVSLTQVENW